MTMINNYPKILAMGHRKNYSILEGNVIIEEKVDGSQLSFGVRNGVGFCKSKNRVIDMSNPDKLFLSAVETVMRILHLLTDGYTYRGEVLSKPKHHTLEYDRTPIGNIMIFDVMRIGDEDYMNRKEKEIECQRIGLEVVPILYEGLIRSSCDLSDLWIDSNYISILGKEKIEGIVIKNYNRFNADDKPMFCKIVREDFKEKNSVTHKTQKNRGIVEDIGMQYNNENRWKKAIQSLRDSGRLKHGREDIGNIIRTVLDDIEDECKEEIADMLYAHFKKTIMGYAVKNLPQWYKEELYKNG